MPRMLSKLRFWSNKSCQSCKGQPTPPPCYSCVLKLETPPPTFTSIHDHFFNEEENLSLYPYEEEEYTYPEDSQNGRIYAFDEKVLIEECPYPETVRIEEYAYPETVRIKENCYSEADQLEEELQAEDDGLCQGRSSPVIMDCVSRQTDVSSYSAYDISGALGNLALAFLPSDQRQQHHALQAAQMPERTRHPTAPVFSNHEVHNSVARTSSSSRLEYLDTDNYEDDRGTLTDSNRSLLAAFDLPIMQMEGHLSTPQPPSPRSVSPLPSQLLIPE